MRGHVRRKGSGWCFVLDVGRQRYRQCPTCKSARRYWLEDAPPPDECSRCGGSLDELEGRRQRWSPIYERRRGPGGAEEALGKALGRRDGGADPIPSDVKLGAYLDTWLGETIRSRVASGKLAATTAQGYATHVRVHLKPRLGTIPLRKLRPGQVEGMLGDVMGEGRSPATATRIRATLSRALSDALRDGLVERNAAQLVDPPNVERRAPSVFTAEELRAIMTACETHRLGALWWLAVLTGMRSSELRGLRWSDVDLEAGTYQVSSTMHTIRKAAAEVVGTSGLVEGRPKNDGSGAVTELSATAVQVLRDHRKAQAAERLAAPVWEDTTGLVFTTSVGTPLHGSNVTRDWYRLLKSAGVPAKSGDGRGRGLHELRRTFATMLREAGVSLEEVQRLGRWSSPRVLLDSYAATRSDRLRSAVDQLGDTIGGR